MNRYSKCASIILIRVTVYNVKLPIFKQVAIWRPNHTYPEYVPYADATSGTPKTEQTHMRIGLNCELALSAFRHTAMDI